MDKKIVSTQCNFIYKVSGKQCSNKTDLSMVLCYNLYRCKNHQISNENKKKLRHNLF
jgi:hypothetical protein